MESAFERGRTVPGKNSADLLQRAQQQKAVLRRKNAARQQSTTAIQPNVASTLKWTQLGPAPITDPDYGFVAGRATAVAVDQTDTTGNTVYVGGAYGGLWRSTNAASPNAANVVWTQLLDSAPTLAVGTIAIRPDNAKLILVGTGNADYDNGSYYGLGILRSEDGGGTWTQISDAAPASGSTRVSFKGVGFSKIAFSSDNGNLIVAAASMAWKSSGLANPPGWGLFYSTDAGKTWTQAVFKDGTAPPAGLTSFSTVVYNAADKTFYAAVSYHGLYSSTDGANWTRLANQPLGAAMDLTACPATGSVGCPIYRAELATRPGATNELYAWATDITNVDRGMFVSKDSGATWTSLSVTGLANCGDATGCDTTGAVANLTLAAVPNGSGTDVYAGASNIFKCSITAQNSKCDASPFINLTHVFGCSPKANPSHVHPGQHGIAFSNTNPNLMYFANDGGIYSTINGPGLNGESCSASNPFANLNGTMGSMAQLFSFSQMPTDESILLAGTPTSGSISTNASVDKGTNGLGWAVYAPGFGVANAGGNTVINPDNANEWFVSTPDFNATDRTAVSISRCANGVGCKNAFAKVITPSTYGDDATGYPAPFMLDPQATNQMILGTCRVWRGSSNPGGAWPGAVSPNLTTGDATTCIGGDVHRMLTSLAAGGPKVAGVGSEVIYAGDDKGHVHVTTNANGAPATWNDRTPLTQGLPNWGSFPISSIAVDTTDTTGATAYLTVQGFNGGLHVYKTTDMGANWTNISGDPKNGGLPDAPANAIAIDPNSATVVYVGTDVGVFVTSDNGAHWAEYGPASGAGVLPNVPVTKLEALKAANKLRASTYGRGMWEIPLASYKDFNQVVTPLTAKMRLGATTVFTATYTALGAFSGDIAVTCTKPDGSALPDGFTCTPSPATVTTGTTSALTITTDATKLSATTYQFKVTGTSGTIVHSSDALSVTLTDFAVSAVNNQNTATVKAGDSVTFPITVTTDSTNSLTDAVTLSCTSTLPDKTTCAWDPTSIVPGAQSILTVKTTAATTAHLTAPALFGQKPLFAIWFGLPGFALAGAGISGRRRKIAALLVLLLVLAALTGFVACGGGSKSSTSTTTAGTPAGTYTITVTGTSGTLTHTTTLTLTVTN